MIVTKRKLCFGGNGDDRVKANFKKFPRKIKSFSFFLLSPFMKIYDSINSNQGQKNSLTSAIKMNETNNSQWQANYSSWQHLGNFKYKAVLWLLFLLAKARSLNFCQKKKHMKGYKRYHCCGKNYKLLVMTSHPVTSVRHNWFGFSYNGQSYLRFNHAHLCWK